ncbi:MAG: recombinase RecA [Candidatus Parcubacteria bacterium]|nr:recombinase RecA [Candidatus Paceibacterota bacterium]
MAKKDSTKTVNQTTTNQEEKKKMIAMIISQIKDTYGDGAIMKMNEVISDTPVISTGSLAIDIATGVCGLPVGRIVEIFGPESSGKTTLALSTIAQAQKNGGAAALIDAEHAFDPTWAAKLGVNLNELYVAQPDNGEQALEIVDSLVRSSAFDVVVIDSVAALVPKSEIEGNMGDASMGVQARLMSQALRKLTGVISKSNTVVIFINQIRLKIGVMFGSPETTTGGQALKFYASQRFDVRKIGMIKSGTEDLGIQVKVKLVKNKLAAPFKTAIVELMFDEPGVISIAGEIIDIGVNFDIISKSGNTYSLNLPGQESVKLGVGREQSKKYFYANPAVLDQARDAIIAEFKEKIRSGKLALESGDTQPSDNPEDDMPDIDESGE